MVWTFRKQLFILKRKLRDRHGPRYSTARGEIHNRPGGQTPAVFVPWGHLRRGPGIRQHPGMVGVDPRARASAQGSAVLPSAGGKRDQLLRRLRVAAEPAGRHLWRTG